MGAESRRWRLIDRLRLGLALILVGLVAGCVSLRPELPLSLTPERIRDLELGVFEVVVKKVEEARIVYAGRDRLPLEELPFRERNDPYESIGTAFAIGGGSFVSAAHVFSLDRAAINRDFFVRDWRGKVYGIDRITRFSQHRDLVEFSLQGELVGVRALKLQPKNGAVGETVYTIGNAHGEGIAIRAGHIASYTYEAFRGAWKDIRFSAPASPGNSGGPLVNTRGEVIGVVVQKSANENLNVATPIAELAKMSRKQAEFFVASAEANADDEPTRDWTFQAKLPAKASALAAKAEADRRSFHLRQWRQVQKSDAPLIFPRDPALAAYYAAQSYTPYLQILSSEGSRGYKLGPEEPLFETTTERGEKVIGLVNDAAFAMAQIELSESLRLTDYVKSPGLLLDLFFANFDFYRDFNGRSIPLESYGAPDSFGMFTDSLQRTWMKAIWRTHHDEATLILNCLPAPSGFGCTLDNIETADETLGGQDKFEAYHAGKMMMSYGGSITAWKRFLALPSKLVPPSLRSVLIDSQKPGEVRLVAGEFRLGYVQPAFSAASQLFVGVGYGLRNPLTPEIYEVRLEHGSDHTIVEHFETVAEPPSSAGGSKALAELLESRGPLDGKSRVETSKATASRLLTQDALANGKKVVRMVSCQSKAAVSVKAAEQTCEAIARTFRGASGQLQPVSLAPGNALAH